ncbi:hypothetical protein HYX04_01655 [Candidatus Woesearchaeota archaeon]|nr:hypothetical protein [Candidatus Woesearchaeota archaeon]
MSLTDVLFGLKTYEMPPDANYTTAQLRSASAIEHFEIYFKSIDVTVSTMSLPDLKEKRHVLRHVRGAYGWDIAIETAEEDVGAIVESLLPITRGASNKKNLQGELKTVISPRGSVTLYVVAGFIDEYGKKGLKPKITGFRIENLPRSLYKKASKAGLPLQEVQETKS